MNRYAFVNLSGRPSVFKVVETDQGVPDIDPNGPWGVWVDITGNTDVQEGWHADLINDVWTFTPLTEQEALDKARGRMQELLEKAGRWLMFNPLQYKADIGVASTAEQTLLVAFKEYCIAVSEVINQSGYPRTINWPVAPF
ncbi:tail fiber assembly protein [Pseudomonas sp. NPDC096950]|uniref:tail fiber assembly protein n=1 Tax=Pseudomonas sp. NPDC096950 TaxID=3364485 RepID=UPI00383BD3E1